MGNLGNPARSVRLTTRTRAFRRVRAAPDGTEDPMARLANNRWIAIGALWLAALAYFLTPAL
jgi:hypothetical protein